MDCVMIYDRNWKNISGWRNYSPVMPIGDAGEKIFEFLPS